MEPIKRQLFEARAEISRLQTIADSNAAYGLAAEKLCEKHGIEVLELKQIADEIERAQQIVKEFIQPPTSIADRLDALGKRFEASSIEFIAEAGKELRAIAAEYREKHDDK